MRIRAIVVTFSVVVLLASVFGSVAAAQNAVLDKLTYFTFNRPVALPGHVMLPPGTYTFRLADATTGRRVVQVLDEQKKVKALLLSIQALRPEPTEKAQVRFMEVPEGQPPAVKIWWYAAESHGYEFVYPKQEAVKLAALTKASVPMIEAPAETAKELVEAPVVRTEPAAEPAAMVPEITFPALPVEQGAVAAAELPRTASPLLLIGLIGLLSVAGASGLRFFR
jgi:hypothetical protein